MAQCEEHTKAGMLYKVIIEWYNDPKDRREIILRRVDEDDCSWRVYEPNGSYESEISYSWNVVEIIGEI